MTTFITLFDINYLTRGFAMIQSVMKHTRGQYKIRVLCLDEQCRSKLESFANDLGPAGGCLTAISLSEVEAAFPELLEVKASRNQVEYYFTLTPYLCLFALQDCQPEERLIYLDADLFFFSDPASLLELTPPSSLAIIEHRFPPKFMYLAEKVGRFNVGWISLVKREAVVELLEDWRSKCKSWCHDYPEDGKFADQGYLNDWPKLLPDVCIINHPGANLAPWNVANHAIEHVSVDGRPLIFFHFHGLRRHSSSIYEINYRGYGMVPKAVRAVIYPEYLAVLQRIEQHYLPGSPVLGLSRHAKSHVYNAVGLFNLAIGVIHLWLRKRVVFRDARPLSPLSAMYYVFSWR